MKIPFLGKVKLVKIKGALKNMPWFLGRHAFMVILVFFIIAIALGGFLFYNYVIVIEKKEPEISASSFIFREDVYQRILEQWQFNDQKFKQFESKNYLSPFIRSE